MTDNQIIEETLRYLSDNSYNYAILIDGEWGCGKTFFIQNVLKRQIEEKEKMSEHPSTTANFLKAWSFYGPDRHYGSCVCGNIQSLSYS